ncbi:MAG: HNH endonuclease, partial [Ruminococcus sp.]|nr:HNH endonuclease [Ruminococcus sp.]
MFYNQGRSLNLNIHKLKEGKNPTGYVSVAISSVKYDRTKRRHLVHRLIATAWLGVHENLQVNHKNGIRTDNRLENLEFCTPLENLNHRSSVLK